MKNITFILFFVFLISIAAWGCQKNEPVESAQSQPTPDLQTMMTGFAQALLNNEPDCAKAAAEMSRYIDDNAVLWRSLMTAEIISRVDGGQSIEDATEAAFKLPPAVEEEMDQSKCLHSDDNVRESVRKYEREIPRKAYEAAEAHYAEH